MFDQDPNLDFNLVFYSISNLVFCSIYNSNFYSISNANSNFVSNGKSGARTQPWWSAAFALRVSS